MQQINEKKTKPADILLFYEMKNTLHYVYQSNTNLTSKTFKITSQKTSNSNIHLQNNSLK